MLLRSPRDVGLLIRDRRRSLHLSQAELARRIGASRHWVMDLEAGKRSVELGLVLASLAALDLACAVRPRGAQPGGPESAATEVEARQEPGLPALDFASVLARTRASGRRVR